MYMYKSIFIDLDDTVWAFSENARDTFQDMYEKYHFERYFDSFHQFYTIYSGRNEILWGEYGAGHITKDELNDMRFSYPLQQVGVEDKALVKAYSDDFFAEIVYKKKTMPHAVEALEYLSSKYNLYIVLSEDIGVHKPFPEIFYFAMSATQSELHTSLMIGDNWENDIAGAKDAGLGQVFYNVKKTTKFSFQPTGIMEDWNEIGKIL